MKQAIISWYAYAESGAAAEAGRLAGPRIREFASEQPAGPTPMGAELADPDRVAALFNDACALESRLTPRGWRYLWSHYGLQGLIDLARRGDWPEAVADEEVADALVRESLAGGYDPVSGQFGELDERTQTFELIDV